MDVLLIPEAVSDYDSLNENLRGLINQKIDELKENPFLGKKLEDKHGMDLRGYRKIYAAQKAYRIIYRIEKDTIVIIGIGKRRNFEIYETVWKRIPNKD